MNNRIRMGHKALLLTKYPCKIVGGYVGVKSSAIQKFEIDGVNAMINELLYGCYDPIVKEQQ